MKAHVPGDVDAALDVFAGRVFRWRPLSHTRGQPSNRMRGLGGVERGAARGEALGNEPEVLRSLMPLERPAALPPSLLALTGGQRDAIVARLLCDGDLEVENSDGQFVSGPPAMSLLYPVPRGASRQLSAHHPLARLSVAGIRYAVALAAAGCSTITTSIYRFGAEAQTADWVARLPARSAVKRWLCVGDVEAGWAGRGKRYVRLRPVVGDPWIRWHRADQVGIAARHKVYISPPAADLPGVVAAALSVAVEMGVVGFKVAGDRSGILRADKLVLYAQDEADLPAICRELELALRGVPGLGVPFTAPVGPGALLSTGVDPTAFRRRPGGPASWRMVVSEALGRAASDVAVRRSPESSLEFVQWRLRLEGIDPVRWAWLS